jgi:hypothetical protein
VTEYRLGITEIMYLLVKYHWDSQTKLSAAEYSKLEESSVRDLEFRYFNVEIELRNPDTLHIPAHGRKFKIPSLLKARHYLISI